MIKLEGITKSFGSLQVLKGIDLEINKGEIVSIVGPSGAGKTTLLQIMGTLDEPDAGTVQIDGTVVSRMKEKELSAFRNKNIGFVFQFHQLLPEFTALENVMIPALIAGVSSKEANVFCKSVDISLKASASSLNSVGFLMSFTVSNFLSEIPFMSCFNLSKERKTRLNSKRLTNAPVILARMLIPIIK